jgi:OPA family glycerol-3-phosphate transporter-like MFS transporter 3
MPRSFLARALVFALTFVSYAFFHLGRKAFSAIKPVFVDTALYPPDGYLTGGGGLSQNEMLGLLDTLFLLFYSAGLYGSGLLADRHDLRIVSALGLALSALLTCLFGLSGLCNVRSLWLYASLWSLNGLAQSTGWPANVAVMGNWFGAEARGAVFGVWTGNASFGNILGTGAILLLLQLAH